MMTQAPCPLCFYSGLLNILSPASGFSSTCEVSVMITDINDHAPEFTTSQVSRRRKRDLGKVLMGDSQPLHISPDWSHKPPRGHRAWNFGGHTCGY